MTDARNALILFLAAALFDWGASATAADAAPAVEASGSAPAEPDREPTTAPLSDEARKLARELDSSLPAGSEARAMYDDILNGSRLGPTEGWFRLAVARTRFGWPAVQTRYDRDGDGAIGRDEFPGPTEDFERLDRDGDGGVAASDLAWSAPAQDRDEAMSLFRPADRDEDGRITAEEFSELFGKLDAEGLGFVTLDDLRAHFARIRPKNQERGAAGPKRETLLRGLARQEIGSLRAGPGLDEPAPDFTLEAFDGTSSVTLSEVIGPQPVVLVFGTFTCGPFRSQAGNVEKLRRRYEGRAKFLMVYVREAHPIDGWHSEGNTRAGVDLAQPKTYDERVAVATRCQDRLNLGMPFLVDTIDDRVGAEYSGMPSRLYLLDRDGKVAYKSGRGPHGFKPAEMEQSLMFLLAEDAEPVKRR